MGGVISASSVAYYRSEGKTVEEISRAMLRASVVGGCTLFLVHMFSAWSCSAWALTLRGKALTPIEKAMNAQGAECMKSHCHAENVGWAFIACVSGVVGSAAAVLRNRVLGVIFLALFAAKGAGSLGGLAYAVYDPNSCAAWVYSRTYWVPVVSLSSVAAFGGLAFKFNRVLRVLGAQGKGVGMTSTLDLAGLDEVGEQMEAVFSLGTEDDEKSH